MKRLIAITLTIMMMLNMFGTYTVGANDDTPMGTPVSTVADFINMKDDGVYYLNNDIDFSKNTYNRNIYTKEFKGILDGNGHSLLGITIKAQNGDIGIFANGFCGTLKNITFGSEDAPVSVSSTGGGFSVGVIAGTMKSGAVIDNTVIYANVKGDGKTSGITSYIPSGSITVTNTKIYGSVTGNPAAGFFALSPDGSSKITIKNSINFASVTAKNLSAGGFYTVSASESGSRSGSLMITGSANYGDISASDWRSGGIVGEFHENSSSTLTVDFCYNRGTVTMSGNNGVAAGIVGGASFNSPAGKRTISNVYNAGTVQNTANSENAYQIAYSHSETTAVTVKNAAFLVGTATKNIVEENVTLSKTVKDLISTVTSYPKSEEGNKFVSSGGSYPLLAHEVTEHVNVEEYSCGRKVCLDCGKILSNSSEEEHIFEHVDVSPSEYLEGYRISTCSACGETIKSLNEASKYRPNFKDGVWEIALADHLKWYQINLNAGLLSGRDSLRLTSDIDLKDEAFTPIGSKDRPFSGTFNGDGHSISSLKVVSTEEGGLFGVIANAANISMLSLISPSIEAEKDAGALFGAVGSGSYIKIEWVLVTGASVTSNTASAGAIAGSTSSASQIKFKQCIADTSSVMGGDSAGGLIGYGNSSELINCYANVNTQTVSNQKIGTLAYYSSNFKYQNSGYVMGSNFSKKHGTKVNAEEFTSGAIANTVNTYANKKVYGSNGITVTMGDPTYAVYYGEQINYTSLLLSDTEDIEVYTDGKTVAIVLKRETGPKLPDLKIKLTSNGKTVEVDFTELSLTRRVKLNDKLYTVSSSSALYTLSITNVTEYEIGTFSSSVVAK